MRRGEPSDPVFREPLARLSAAHPLPAGWNLVSCFVERVALAAATMHLVGLVSEGPGDMQATGSAASPVALPIDRAYFELLERTSLLAVMAAGSDRFPLLDGAGRVRGSCAREEAFPSAPAGASWAYARSNGVAAGASFADACRAAEFELIERDRVLRSWYGQSLPRRLSTPTLAGPFAGPEADNATHHFQAYQFGDDRCRGPVVVGVFGFPRHGSAPLVYGFGAGEVRSTALSHAERECRQRLGFLWGEDVPQAAPAFATTAAFHQEYYLWPGGHPHLRAWLAGDRARQGDLRAVPRRPRQAVPAQRLFIDLTFGPAAHGVRVVKALPVDELALVFGQGHPQIGGPRPETLAPHPIV